MIARSPRDVDHKVQCVAENDNKTSDTYKLFLAAYEEKSPFR